MLSIQNVSKTYANGTRALNDVTLDIPTGMYGLLGPNGAGKSSLMRTLATLQQPDNGQVLFDGIDVLNNPKLIRERLGYLPQDFGVYPRINAWDMLSHMAVLKGFTQRSERKLLVEELLKKTNLYKHRKKALSSYSGGMRQRFGIAQALIGDPDLVIVDEPTAGLDPEERNRFHNLLADIGENKVVILSTHIVDDVADLCPRMAIMTNGQIALHGEPSELIKTIQGRVWSKTIDKQEVQEYMASLTVISSRLFSGITKIRVLSDEQPEDGFELVNANLEDVYFSTVLQNKKNKLSHAA